MLKKIRRSLSKGKGDKLEKIKINKKEKKSHEKKLNKSQSDDNSNEKKSKENVKKKLDFNSQTDIMNEEESLKMNRDISTNSSINNSVKDDETLPYIEDETLPYIEDENEDEEINQQNKLSEEFPKTVKILENENGSKVYLIGTAHFSKESCDDVKYVINKVRPDVVVLEICQQRAKTLILDENVLWNHIMNFNMNQVKSIIKENGLIQGIIQILFLYVSKEISKQTGLLPGSEMRTAIFESKKIPNCICKLGDRPFHITFKRSIEALSLWEKLKVGCQILFSDIKITNEEIEKYKESDALETYLKELGKNYPKMKEALLDERDMFLAHSLQSAATLVPRGENAVCTQRLKESRNSLASVEQQLVSCKHELDNFKKIKSSSNSNEFNNHDAQIKEYENKFEKLKLNYNLIYEQVNLDTQKLTTFSQHFNSENYGPAVVVGVVGIGHLEGITKYYKKKISQSDIEAIMQIPEPSLKSVIIKKVFYYSFLTATAVGIYKYVIPSSIKSSVISFSLETIKNSSNFVHKKLSH